MQAPSPNLIGTLNWKEIAALADQIRPEVEGLFIDRIIVPERARFPGGYLKGEWAIRLTGRRSEGVFLFSVRTRHPYFTFIPGKGPKAATGATRSPFDLELSKHLKGQRLVRFETLNRERTLVLWFDDLGLVINMIPAAPEALLVRRKGDSLSVITRSRAARGDGSFTYTFPDGLKAPENPPFRAELVSNVPVFSKTLESSLELEAFELRSNAALREIRALDKQAQERMRQTETALREAENDQNWQRFGDLLKASMYEQPEMVPIDAALKASKAFKGVTHIRRVRDYETEQEVALPSDPKLDVSQQVEKYYQLARRKARRIEEAGSRFSGLKEAHERLAGLLASPPLAGDWKGLEKLERAAFGGSAGGAGAASAEALAGRNKKSGAWLGKTFVSKDGLSIFVGRSKDENLELTFKHSRGNDIWMHVRGRPGAHLLIPLQPGKSAPLETLLDAAVLCIYYSGGEKWGKTEVDYTFKKYVKRIKDSTEASYTNNKTLIVEPEQARLKRLLGN
ncbi:MAG: NFACT RNA binding domain-containing protein [Bdellovibrionia bacterium]